jgi:hypothetical protein
MSLILIFDNSFARLIAWGFSFPPQLSNFREDSPLLLPLLWPQLVIL